MIPCFVRNAVSSQLFIIMLLVGLVSGVLWRDQAIALADYRHWLLFTVMFMVGLEQSLPHLAREIRRLGPILLSLAISYLLFPVAAWLWGFLFFRSGPELAGFVVLGAVPVTLTSAVIYTRLDKGNAHLALVIVLLSQVLGVLVTPALIALFLSQQAKLAVVPMMRQLFQYFLVPLALGMLARRFLPLSGLAKHLTRPEQVVVALFVFMGAGRIPPESPWLLVGKSLLSVWLLQMLIVIVVRLIVKRYPAVDQTALFYTSTQKTLSVGLYLLLSYFPSAAILPMVVYHLLQLTIGRLYWVPPQERT